MIKPVLTSQSPDKKPAEKLVSVRVAPRKSVQLTVTEPGRAPKKVNYPAGEKIRVTESVAADLIRDGFAVDPKTPVEKEPVEMESSIKSDGKNDVTVTREKPSAKSAKKDAPVPSVTSQIS